MKLNRNLIGAAVLALALAGANAAEARDHARRGEAALFVATRLIEIANQADVAQQGQRNGAAIAQTGAANASSINQNGDDQTAIIRQTGDANTAGIRQYGRGNTTAITQTGSNNAACVIQIGRNLDASLAQTGDNNSNGILQTRGGSREIPPILCAVDAHGRGYLMRAIHGRGRS